MSGIKEQIFGKQSTYNLAAGKVMWKNQVSQPVKVQRKIMFTGQEEHHLDVFLLECILI